jgi:hypothetical protein
MLPVAERRISDPPKIGYTPGWWSLPILAFSNQNVMLEKKAERLPEMVRFLANPARRECRSVRPAFHHVPLQLARRRPLPDLHRRNSGAHGGRVQLFRDEKAVGEAADLNAADRKKSGLLPLGVLDMREGANEITFKMLSGTDFELSKIVFERQ